MTFLYKISWFQLFSGSLSDVKAKLNEILVECETPESETNGDPVEKIQDQEQPTADEPEIANDEVLEEDVKDSTPEKIIEVPMPGTNESIIINPEAFTSKESSFDVFDNESIVNGSRDDNSAQESKLMSGKSFLTDSSNQPWQRTTRAASSGRRCAHRW